MSHKSKIKFVDFNFQVHHPVEKLFKIYSFWYKMCHFWHTFSIFIAPAKQHSGFDILMLSIHTVILTGTVNLVLNLVWQEKVIFHHVVFRKMSHTMKTERWNKKINILNQLMQVYPEVWKNKQLFLVLKTFLPGSQTDITNYPIHIWRSPSLSELTPY